MEDQQNDPSLHRHLLSGWRFTTMIATIILSVIGYLIFTLWGGWSSVSSAAASVGPLGIGIALALSLVSYFLRFLRWQLFLKALGHSVPWKPSLRIYISGFSLTITPGKSGEALRSVFLKDYRVPFRKSFAAFLSERISDLIAVALLASSALWLYPKSRSILLVVAAVVIFILVAVQKNSWLRWLENKAKNLFPDRYAHVIEFVLETIIAFRSCFTPKIFISSIVLGVFAWASQGLALYILINLLGYGFDVLTALFIYGFSMLVGAITFLPGGLGGTEVSMVQLLILNHIPPPVAVAATLIIRFSTLWFSVVLGVLALPKKQLIVK